MAPKYFFLLCCLAVLSRALAEEQPQPEAEETQEEESGLTNFQIPDLTLSDGVMRAISMAGALATGVAGLAAILSFILPIMGFRSCLIMGGCDEATPYNSNSVYDQQGYGPYQYNNGFKKRSLEYVGPILKALSSAYEKYGQPGEARKLTVKVADHK